MIQSAMSQPRYMSITYPYLLVVFPSVISQVHALQLTRCLDHALFLCDA